MMQPYKKVIEQHIDNHPIDMEKLISRSFLSGEVYESRRATTLEELSKYNKEGFYISTELSFWMFNALLSYKEKK